MRWAVGDYEPTTVRNLALALSTGAIQADGSSRELTVVTMAKDNGVVVDVSCSCAKGSGTCHLGITEETVGIFCLGCRRCQMVIEIPTALLQLVP
jgi:hypothetical protein